MGEDRRKKATPQDFIQAQGFKSWKDFIQARKSFRDFIHARRLRRRALKKKLPSSPLDKPQSEITPLPRIKHRRKPWSG